MNREKKYPVRLAMVFALAAVGFFGIIGQGHAQETGKAEIVIQRIQGDTVFASGRQFILTEETRFTNQAGANISIGEVSLPAKGLIVYRTLQTGEDDVVQLLATKIVVWIEKKPPTPE